MIKKSIATKLSFVTILSMIIIFIASGWWILKTTNEELSGNIIESLQLKTDLAVNQISETFSIAAQVARQAAQDKNIRTYLAEVDEHEQITTHPLYKTVSDTLIAYNNSFEKLYFVWIANDRANFYIDNILSVSAVGYDASARPWYDLALGTNDVAFTAPYADVGTGAIVVSSIIAVRDEAGKDFGFVSADVSLETIPKIMQELKIGESGTNFLITSNGTIVHADDQNLLDEETNISSIAELSEFGKLVLEGNTGISETTYNDQEYLVAYEPLPINGWGVLQLVDKKEAYSGLKDFEKTLITIFITATLILALFIYININSTIKPIKEATAFAIMLGQGDFTNKVPEVHLRRQDEIGDLAKAFKGMTESFNRLVSEIILSAGLVTSSSEELKKTANIVAHSSHDMTNTIEEIARGATEQAENTELGASKTYELGELIEANKEHMESLNAASSNMVDLVGEGLEIVNDLTIKTKDTNAAAQEIFEVINKTDKSTSKIGEASNVIASIAQQTNLLALNAAIEAARAGDAGRGFAVVAEEIRKLAEQSTKSTEQIDSIVQELINSSRKAVESINDVNTIINEQVGSVQLTEKKYLEISNAVEISTKALNNLNISEKNMEKKKVEILDTIQNLSAIAEENAASTEEASASVIEQSSSMGEIVNASSSLSELAEELNASVKAFKITK